MPVCEMHNTEVVKEPYIHSFSTYPVHNPVEKSRYQKQRGFEMVNSDQDSATSPEFEQLLKASEQYDAYLKIASVSLTEASDAGLSAPQRVADWAHPMGLVTCSQH